MKKITPFLLLALLGAPFSPAADTPTPTKDKPADKAPAAVAAPATPAKPDPVWLAKAIAAYPLDTCVVGGDKLGGDMGPPVDFVYHQDGQPDRLVRFCCKDCVADFTKEPAKYLKMIDDAAAKKKL